MLNADFRPRVRKKRPRSLSGDVSARGQDIHGVKRLAGGHKEPIALAAAETDIGAVFRQPDHADAFAIGRHYLNPWPRTAPDVPVGVAADAVGSGRSAGA